MIKKTVKGYEVISHEGKILSKPNLSHEAALKRLREIEYFKHQEIQKKMNKNRGK